MHHLVARPRVQFIQFLLQIHIFRPSISGDAVGVGSDTVNERERDVYVSK